MQIRSDSSQKLETSLEYSGLVMVGRTGTGKGHTPHTITSSDLEARTEAQTLVVVPNC